MSFATIRPFRLPLVVLTLPLLAGLGCTGGGGDVSGGVLGTLLSTARKNSVTVRVVNETIYSLEVELRVDGQLKFLPPCTSTQRICDYLLTTCPSLIEVLQESRRNTDEAFMGGRNFEGNPEFTFTSDEFDCGDTLILQFSETQASAQMM